MEQVTLTASDGYTLSLLVWETEHARALVQIIHGMEEHKERYEPFAQALCAAGYSVIISDMRGHGKDAPTLGFFSEKDGWRLLLSDQMQVTAYAKERFGVKKVFLFAHSMGTIIARNLLLTQSQDYEKVVLCGYPNYPGKAALAFALSLAGLSQRIHGAVYHSKLIQQAAIGSFNKKIKHPRTDVDWICSDERVVDEYIKDPYCGHGFTVSAFRDLFTLTARMHDPRGAKNIAQNLPLFLIRGACDPCTGGDAGATDSHAALEAAGFSNITTKTYEHMRHELLNEKGHETVIADVIGFYSEPSGAARNEKEETHQ